MKKNPIPVLVLLLFFIGKIAGQQLTPIVISSSGGFYNNTEGMLSFTAGEMSAVETFETPFAILTQGFQQPWDISTNVAEQRYNDFAFSIFPNPAYGDFNLVTESSDPQQISVNITDLLGRRIFSTEYYQSGKIHIQPIDLPDVPQGMYIVTISPQYNLYFGPQILISSKIHIVK